MSFQDCHGREVQEGDLLIHKDGSRYTVVGENGRTVRIREEQPDPAVHAWTWNCTQAHWDIGWRAHVVVDRSS